MRKFINIIEGLQERVDIDRHIEDSAVATIALREFRKAFAEDPSRNLISIRGVHPSLELAQFKLVRPHPQAKDPNFIGGAWGDASTYRPRGAGEHTQGWVEPSLWGEGNRIHFRLPEETEDAEKFIASHSFETLFRHEYQHHLDDLAGRNDGKKSINPEDDRAGYVNSDVEYSAMLAQQAEPLLAWLRAAKNGEDTTGLYRIEPDFAKFMRNGQHATHAFKNQVPFKEFDKKTRVRYMRDMAEIHKAAVAVSQNRGKKIKLLGRIVFWLGSKFGIEL